MFSPQLALRPNCLLTRRPLKFVTGPRSLFFYKKPWGDIPEILFEHGYKVELISLPFRGTQLRKKALENQIRRLHNSHLFVDLVTFEELGLADFSLDSSTITIVSKETPPLFAKPQIGLYHFQALYKKSSLNYRLHQKWCAYGNVQVPEFIETLASAPRSVWEKLLDHCVELAELDFMERS